MISGTLLLGFILLLLKNEENKKFKCMKNNFKKLDHRQGQFSDQNHNCCMRADMLQYLKVHQTQKNVY